MLSREKITLYDNVPEQRCLQRESKRGVCGFWLCVNKISLQRTHKTPVTSLTSGDRPWVAGTETGSGMFSMNPFCICNHVAMLALHK